MEPTLDPQEYVQRRIRSLRPEMTWEPASADAMRQWQDDARARLSALLGGLMASSPRNVTVQRTEAFKGYRRETITFESLPGLLAFAYYLVPDGCAPSSPAILCLPGHGRGVDSIVGIAEDGSQRELGAPDEYQADFALQCVARGWPVLALEQISFGHRRDERARAAGPGATSCTRDAMAAQMLGETLGGWRVADTMCAVTYLMERAEVDAERIGIMGISGGGLTALWTAALDTRIYAAVVSGYFNTFADSVLSLDHCVDNYAPGLLRLLEMPDFAAMVAPRALFVESGDRDPIFPVAAFTQAVERAQRIYGAFGADERFDSVVFPGEHRFDGAGAFRFLEAQVRVCTHLSEN